MLRDDLTTPVQWPSLGVHRTIAMFARVVAGRREVGLPRFDYL